MKSKLLAFLHFEEIKKLNKKIENQAKIIEKLQDFINTSVIENGYLIQDLAFEILNISANKGEKRRCELADGILDIVGHDKYWQISKKGSIDNAKDLLNSTGYKNIPNDNFSIISVKFQDDRRL